jgi:serine/threonine protein kinase/tetratricopeptide (TPR) repeat protein
MPDLRDQLQDDLGTAYTLEKELGGGGMSRVFLAKDNKLGRQIVIKILPPEMTAAVSGERFRREVQLAANLQHPHIVPLLSAGETNGLPYFTMPYVKGESLKAHLVKVGELPLSEAIRILREVASALAYAHENSVVHRDIKPDNVLISGDSAVVTDFGVAKALTASSEATGSSLTSMGVALGTPAYMAPEQATADPHIDHRADLYALGVMAYEMVTGSTPFANRTPQATLSAHVIETPEPVTRKRSNTPPGLAAIIMRCLEKRASDRPQSAREVVNLLDALTTPSGGMTPTASYRVPAKRPRWMIPAAVVLVAVLGLGAFAATRFKSRGKDPAAAFASQKSIAVLPFKNMSGDPANEFFSDGLSEELLNVLSQIRGLRVAARGSSFQFKGKDADIREIGQKLGVATVLDGSVRKSGDQVRITVQLIDSKNGYQLWSETFDRTMKDVFAVQNEITRAIGEALNLQFAAGSAKLAQGRPVNPEAYELFLKGVFAMKSNRETALKSALANFQQAIRIDSGYASAWAQVAHIYSGMGAAGFIGPEEANRQAEAAIKRALSLDPDISIVQSVYAAHLRSLGEMEKSEAVLKSLIEKNPNQSSARMNYAILLAMRGNADGAVNEMQMAKVLNPLSTSALYNLGLLHMMAGKSTEAIAEFRELVALRPDDPRTLVTFAQALAEGGQHAEAIKQAERASSLASDDSYVELTRAYTYARAGRRADALKIANAEASKPDVVNYVFEMAGVYSALGDKDRAFEWLDKLQTVQGSFLKLDPLIAPLRDDPRYAEVLAKWKLN